MNFYEAVEATNQLQNCLIEWEKENKKHWNESCRHVFTDELDVREIAKFDDERLIPILEELFQKGADLNHLEKERGFSVITRIYWSEKLIKFFVVDRGMIEVNSTDQNGDTLLHLAFRYSMWALPMNEDIYGPACNDNPAYDTVIINVVKFLLDELNADPNVTNLRGETALFTLIREGINNSSWFDKLQYTYFSRIFVKMLLERGAKVATKNIDGQSILHLDIEGMEDILIKHVDAEDIELRTSSWLYSKTPLMVAATYDNLDLCKLLIERGAFVNATDLQGYTALNHAVSNRRTAYKCAEFLINMGADPNGKSSSGMDAYDISLYNYCTYYHGMTLFTYGLTPAKQVEMYEISGAMDIMRNRYNDANEMFENVVEVCKNYDLKHTDEFLANYEFFRQNRDNPRRAIRPNEEIYLSAINTIIRLSQQGTLSKFWKLLSLLIIDERDLNKFNSHLVNLLSEELIKNRIDDLTSFEEAHFKLFRNKVEDFDNWLMFLVRFGRKQEATSERISLFHSLVRFIVACFDKLKHETKSNKVSLNCMDSNIRLCHALTLLHSQFGDVISEAAFNENKQLLRKLVQLDLTDAENCNSLIHVLLRDHSFYKYFKTELLLVLLDFDFVKVTTRNGMGYELIQRIDWNSYRSDEALKLFVKIVDRGGHFDAKNINFCDGEQPTLKEVFETLKSNNLWFRYDSLQCACARVLAKNIEPYRNRVPKKMVDFINQHNV